MRTDGVVSMLSRVDPFAAAEEAAAWVRAATGVVGVDAGLVLGSGWAPAVEA